MAGLSHREIFIERLPTDHRCVEKRRSGARLKDFMVLDQGWKLQPLPDGWELTEKNEWGMGEERSILPAFHTVLLVS